MNSTRPKKLPSTENDVKAMVVDWFTNQGGKSWAIVAGPRGVHGIADRVGLMPITVTQAMVGKTVGIFVAVEAKKPGRRGEKRAGATQAQVDFLWDVLNHNGVAGLADCHVDLEALSAAITLLQYDRDSSHLPSLCKQLAVRVNGETA